MAGAERNPAGTHSHAVASELRRDVQKAHRALFKQGGWPDPGLAYAPTTPQGRFISAMAEYATTEEGRADLSRRRDADEAWALRYASSGDQRGKAAWARFSVITDALTEGTRRREMEPAARAYMHGREQGLAERAALPEPAPAADVPQQHADNGDAWRRGRRSAVEPELRRPHTDGLGEAEDLDVFSGGDEPQAPADIPEKNPTWFSRLWRRPEAPQPTRSRGVTPRAAGGIECGAPAPTAPTGRCTRKVARNGDRCFQHPKA